jgi:hypothetical protein
MPEPFQPLSPFFVLLPKKEGGKIDGYFRFLSVQNAAMPMMQATATAASIAISVLISGASAVVVGSVGSGVVGSGVVGSGVVGSGSVGVGSVCVGCVGAGAAGSGSIVAAGVGAGSTVK